MKISFRFRLLRPWLTWVIHRPAGVFWRAPLTDLLIQQVQRSLAARASSWVEEMTEQDGFKVIKFHQLRHRVWWPANLPLHDLWVVADEQFTHRHWHRYECDGSEVQADDVVMDCGASEGLFALTIVDRCRHLHLIEPSPLYLSALKRAFAGFSNVTIHPVGLSDYSARADFKDTGVTSEFSAGQDSSGSISITTADELLSGHAQQPTYIKADIEGWELPMLRGARHILQASVRRLAITVYHVPKNNYWEMQTFLKSVHPDFTYRYVGVGDIMTVAGQPVPIVMHAVR